MACDSFLNCISDPISGTGAASTFTTLSRTLVFSINLTMYVIYAILIVFVGYNLFKTIYVLMKADSAESFEKFREGVTNAVLTAVGLVLILSARFILVNALRLVGIPDAENIFMNPF